MKTSKRLSLLALLLMLAGAVQAQTLYWLQSTGGASTEDWDDPANWTVNNDGTYSNGSSAIPDATTDVVFNNFSFTAAGQTVVIDATGAACQSMTWAGVTNSPTFQRSGGDVNSRRLSIYGSLTLESTASMTWDLDADVDFLAPGTTVSINAADQTFGEDVIFDNATATFNLASAMAVSNFTRLERGTLNTNGFALTTAIFDSPRATTLNLGASQIILTGNGTVMSLRSDVLLDAGTSTIEVTGNFNNRLEFGEASRDFYNLVYSGPISGSTVRVNAGGPADLITFNDIDIQNGKTLEFPASSTTNIVNLTLADNSDLIFTGNVNVSGALVAGDEVGMDINGVSNTWNSVTIGGLTTDFIDFNNINVFNGPVVLDGLVDDTGRIEFRGSTLNSTFTARNAARARFYDGTVFNGLVTIEDGTAATTTDRCFFRFINQTDFNAGIDVGDYTWIIFGDDAGGTVGGTTTEFNGPSPVIFGDFVEVDWEKNGNMDGPVTIGASNILFRMQQGSVMASTLTVGDNAALQFASANNAGTSSTFTGAVVLGNNVSWNAERSVTFGATLDAGSGLDFDVCDQAGTAQFTGNVTVGTGTVFFRCDRPSNFDGDVTFGTGLNRAIWNDDHVIDGTLTFGGTVAGEDVVDFRGTSSLGNFVTLSATAGNVRNIDFEGPTNTVLGNVSLADGTSVRWQNSSLVQGTFTAGNQVYTSFCTDNAGGTQTEFQGAVSFLNDGFVDINRGLITGSTFTMGDGAEFRTNDLAGTTTAAGSFTFGNNTISAFFERQAAITGSVIVGTGADNIIFGNADNASTVTITGDLTIGSLVDQADALRIANFATITGNLEVTGFAGNSSNNVVDIEQDISVGGNVVFGDNGGIWVRDNSEIGGITTLGNDVLIRWTDANQAGDESVFTGDVTVGDNVNWLTRRSVSCAAMTFGDGGEIIFLANAGTFTSNGDITIGSNGGQNDWRRPATFNGALTVGDNAAEVDFNQDATFNGTVRIGASIGFVRFADDSGTTTFNDSLFVGANNLDFTAERQVTFDGALGYLEIGPGAEFFLTNLNGGANTFNDIYMQPGSTFRHNNQTGPATIEDLTMTTNCFAFLNPNSTTTVTGVWTASTTGCDEVNYVDSDAGGNAATVLFSGQAQTWNNVFIDDFNVSGAGFPLTVNNGVASEPVTGNITFPAYTRAADTYYWVGGQPAKNNYGQGTNEEWRNPANWSLTSGDASTPNGCVPGAVDNVIFDANSFTAAGQEVRINNEDAQCHDMTWTATSTAEAPTFVGDGQDFELRINGSMVFQSGLAWNDNNTDLYLEATGPETITCNGCELEIDMIIENAAGSWTLQDDFTNLEEIFQRSGEVDLNGFTLTTDAYDMYDGTDVARTLTMPAGSNMVVTGGNGDDAVDFRAITNTLTLAADATSTITFNTSFNFDILLGNRDITLPNIVIVNNVDVDINTGLNGTGADANNPNSVVTFRTLDVQASGATIDLDNDGAYTNRSQKIMGDIIVADGNRMRMYTTFTGVGGQVNGTVTFGNSTISDWYGGWDFFDAVSFGTDTDAIFRNSLTFASTFSVTSTIANDRAVLFRNNVIHSGDVTFGNNSNVEYEAGSFAVNSGTVQFDGDFTTGDNCQVLLTNNNQPTTETEFNGTVNFGTNNNIESNRDAIFNGTVTFGAGSTGRFNDNPSPTTTFFGDVNFGPNLANLVFERDVTFGTVGTPVLVDFGDGAAVLFNENNSETILYADVTVGANANLDFRRRSTWHGTLTTGSESNMTFNLNADDTFFNAAVTFGENSTNTFTNSVDFSGAPANTLLTLGPGSFTYVDEGSTFLDILFEVGSTMSSRAGSTTSDDITMDNFARLELPRTGTFTVAGAFDINSGCEAWSFILGSFPGTRSVLVFTGQEQIWSNVVVKDFEVQGPKNNATGPNYGLRIDEVVELDNVGGVSSNFATSVLANYNSNANATILYTNEQSKDTYYWIGDSGQDNPTTVPVDPNSNWTNPGNWSLSSGGPANPDECVPNPLDDVIFDDNSFSAGGQLVNIDIEVAACDNLTFDETAAAGDDVDAAVSVEGSTNTRFELYGDLMWHDNVTNNFQGTWAFLKLERPTNPASTTVIENRNAASTIVFNGPIEFETSDDAGTIPPYWQFNNPVDINDPVPGDATRSEFRQVNGEFALNNNDLSVDGWFVIETAAEFFPGTGTLTMDGDANNTRITTNNQDLYNLVINKTDRTHNVYIRTNDITVTNDLTITSGELWDSDGNNEGPWAITGGNALTMADDGRLHLGDNGVNDVNSTFPSTFATITLSDDSEVVYRDRGEQQVYGPLTYGDLLITNGNDRTDSLSGAITVNGTLRIDNNSRLKDTGFQITGNLNPGSELDMNGDSWLTLGDEATATTMPDFSGYDLEESTFVNYRAGVAQTVKGLNAGDTNASYGNLWIVNAGWQDFGTATVATKSLDAQTYVREQLYIRSYSELDDAGFQINAKGDGSNDLDMEVLSILSLGSGASATVFPAFRGNEIELDANSTVVYKADTDQEVRRLASGTASRVYGNLTVRNTGIKSLADTPTPDDGTNALDIRGELLVESTATLYDNGWQISGSGGAATLAMEADSELRLGSATTATTYPSSFAGRTLDVASTIVYNAGVAQDVEALQNATFSSTENYGNLTIRNEDHETLAGTTVAVKTLQGPATVRGDFSVLSYNDMVDDGNQITGSATGSLLVEDLGELTLGAATATLFPTDYIAANISLEENSTVEYAAEADQTISNQPGSGALEGYGNLEVTGLSGGSVGYMKALAGDVKMKGNLIIWRSNNLVDAGFALIPPTSGANGKYVEMGVQGTANVARWLIGTTAVGSTLPITATETWDALASGTGTGQVHPQNSTVRYISAQDQDVNAEFPYGNLNTRYDNDAASLQDPPALRTVVSPNGLASMNVYGNFAINGGTHVVDDGIQIAMQNGNGVNSVFTMTGNAELSLGNGTVATSFPTGIDVTDPASIVLEAATTVRYQSSQPQNVTRLFNATADANYANLELTNNSNKTLAAAPAVSDGSDDCLVRGQFTLDNSNVVLNGQHLILEGTFQREQDNPVEVFVGDVNADLEVRGSGDFAEGGLAKNTLQFSTPSATMLEELSVVRTSGIVTLGTDLIVGDGGTDNGRLNIDNGALVLNGNRLTVNSLENQFTSSSGTITGSATSELVINGEGNFGDQVVFTTGSEQLFTFEVNRQRVGVNDRVRLGSDLTTVVGGVLNLIDGELGIGNHTLEISGEFRRTAGTFVGSTSSNMIVSGSGPFNAMVMDDDLEAHYTLADLTISRTSNDIPLASDLILGVSGGTTGLDLQAGSNLVLGTSGEVLLLRGQNTTNDGTLKGNMASNLTIEGTGVLVGPLKFAVGGGFRQLNDFTVNRSSGEVTLANDLIVNGQLAVLDGFLEIAPGATNLLTLAGTYAGAVTGFIKGSTNSYMSVTGNGDSGDPVVFGPTAADKVLHTLTNSRNTTGTDDFAVGDTLTVATSFQHSGTTTAIGGLIIIGGEFVHSGSGFIGSDGSGSFQFDEAGAVTTANLYFRSEFGVLNDLFINRTSQIPTLATDLEVSGTLDVAAGAELQVGANTLTLSGTNFMTGDGGLSSNASSSVVIGGSGTAGALKVAENAGTYYLGTLQMIRVGSATLGSPVELRASGNALFLDNGILFTDLTNVLTVSSSSRVNNSSLTIGGSSGGSDASHIDGPIAMEVGTSLPSFQALRFPTGSNGRLMEIGLTNVTAGSTFRAEYNDAVSPNLLDVINVPGTDPDYLVRVSAIEHWILDRISGTSSAAVLLHYRNPISDVSNDATERERLRVAKFNGTAWESEGISLAFSGLSGSSGYVVASQLSTTFSPFSLGATDQRLNPLPVELASFTGQWEDGRGVRLNWTTLSELENRGFELWRAEGSAEEFEKVADYDRHAELMGQGTSSQTTEYAFLDASATKGRVYYYKLVQVDFDDTATESEVIRVATPLDVSQLTLYPNPTSGHTTLSFVTDAESPAALELYSATGQKVSTLFEGLLPAGAQELPIDASRLPSGIYVIRLVAMDTVRQVKLVVN